MMYKIVFLYVFICFLTFARSAKHKEDSDNHDMEFEPCTNESDVKAVYIKKKDEQSKDRYRVYINKPLHPNSRVKVGFDSNPIIYKDSPSTFMAKKKNDVEFLISEDTNNFNFHVKSPDTSSVSIPRITSIIVDGTQICDEPNPESLDAVADSGNSIGSFTPSPTCGRRKVMLTELITNGLDSKPGDWPWHAAIYSLKGVTFKYICGGTLLSKTVVVTAAHCAAVRGIAVLPEILSVIFGKFNLIGGDIATQEKEVHRIIIHEEFNFQKLHNDLAILKLRSEVVYNDYVQPACIWSADVYKKLPTKQVFGAVVGWGFDQTDTLSSTLKYARIPKVSETTCLKSNPVFYANFMTDRKFCAGWNNGTSACNGDSGGGFVVFVPDTARDDAPEAKGAWYIRGIISSAAARPNVPICDPFQYVIFTDLAKYRGWLETQIGT